MTDEILIVDNTVEEIEVEEFNSVPTGTIITTTHGYGKGEQHSIEDITGLKTKLDNIEKLKPVRSNLSGHADYYLWGDTEDIGTGYFVRLGEDGMIHKCTNETIVLRPKDLLLDTDENGNVIIYALAGNITTADITKYYVVGTTVPYDIYAYDGIEYVQKSAYSYDGKQVIKTCHTTDILGVTVSSAGFIGNDENIVDTYTSVKATDINYALVATTGVVDVLCGYDIIVGDYVFPTVNGWAAKSTGSYGYLVTALVQNGEVVQDINKEEILYARIVLSQSMVNAKKISDNVDYLLGETKRLDENITTFGNTAEEALKRAEELVEAAQQSANTSSQIIQDATNAAVNAQNSATNAWDAAEQAAPIAQKAAEDAKVAQEAASTLKNDAITEANELATQIATDKSNETLNTVKALEYRLDEYTVGQYSQAYGLTFAQAKAILPPGTVFIPMDEDPTASGARQEYKEVYASGEETDIEQTFTAGYSYVWGGESWLVDKTVLITRTPTEQTEGDYWFVVKEYDGEEYNCGSLYRWENGAWKEVAIRKENVMNRTMAHLYHSDDTIRQSVNTVDGKVAVVETKVTETNARVGLVASVPTELVGVKPANYNSDIENIDIIHNETDLTTNWQEYAISKGNGTYYYVVGEQLPYDVYICVVEGNIATFTRSNTITYDGVNFYKANIASIITSVNEDGSGIQLNANKIQFNGQGIFQDENGNITQIDGNYITTGTIDASRANITNLSASEIVGAINNSGDSSLKINADHLIIDGANISLTGKTISISADECLGITSTNFTVDQSGNITAQNANLSGYVDATSGKIGEMLIGNGGIESDDASVKLNATGLSIQSTDAALNVGSFTMQKKEDNITYIETDNALTIMGKQGDDVISSISLLGDTGTETVSIPITLTFKSFKYTYEGLTEYANLNFILAVDADPLYTENISVHCSLIGSVSNGGGVHIHSTKEQNVSLQKGDNKFTFVFTYNDINDLVFDDNEYDYIGIQITCEKLNNNPSTLISLFPPIGNHFNYDFNKQVFDTVSLIQKKAKNNVKIKGNVIPSENYKYSLGDNNNKWSAIYAQTSVIQTSDKDEKNTITSLSDTYGKIFDDLKPVTYKYNDGTSDRLHTGFIAQDVKNAIEDNGLTTKDFAAYCEWEESDGNIACGIRYSELIALCVDQIQKLKLRIKELENKIDTI